MTWMFGGIGLLPVMLVLVVLLLPGQEDLIGRVVVRFRRPSRNAYLWGEKYGDQLEIVEIKPQRMAFQDFPGYNRVVLSYADLRLVYTRQEPGWKAALSSVQGIYLIADHCSGKLYVGSACGREGIWRRWASYADTGHGGNIELQQALRQQGPGYTSNFQYSILEIADLNATPEAILKRESYWKEALLSRVYGYNKN